MNLENRKEFDRAIRELDWFEDVMMSHIDPHLDGNKVKEVKIKIKINVNGYEREYNAEAFGLTDFIFNNVRNNFLNKIEHYKQIIKKL